MPTLKIVIASIFILSAVNLNAQNLARLSTDNGFGTYHFGDSIGKYGNSLKFVGDKRHQGCWGETWHKENIVRIANANIKTWRIGNENPPRRGYWWG
jgi:hypothetical protein